ncbi:hypothetical protein HanIR_Chr12g0579861 [Helianthus annuus]|nr:hypothetical protein HanIR_Chr12g0579861 [Helianthus annuus]
MVNRKHDQWRWQASDLKQVCNDRYFIACFWSQSSLLLITNSISTRWTISAK